VEGVACHASIRLGCVVEWRNEKRQALCSPSQWQSVTFAFSSSRFGFFFEQNKVKKVNCKARKDALGYKKKGYKT